MAGWRTNTVAASARNGTAITPSDTTLVTCGGIYIGATGDLAIQFQDGFPTVTFVGVLQGTFMPLSLSNGHVMAATTASSLIGVDW